MSTQPATSINLHKAASTTHDHHKGTEKLSAHDLMPVGLLAIHIKRCKNLKVQDGSKTFSKRLPVSLYMKMSVGDITKTSSVNDVRCNNNVGTVFDDLKHFVVTINNKLDDESNKIKFALMGFQGNNKHKKLAGKEIHLFNIIRNLFIVETLEMARNAHVTGELDVEMAFSYGSFGYGYSSQLQTKTHTPSEQIGQSLFYRAEPPFDRKHDNKDVMTAVPVPHPTFIKWPVQVDLAIAGNEYMTDSITDLLTGKEKTTQEYPLLKAHMSKRMQELQGRYASLGKRSQRIAFLQNLVSTKINPELEENQDELLFTKNVKVVERSTEGIEHGADEHTDYFDEVRGLLTRIAMFLGIKRPPSDSPAVTTNVEGAPGATRSPVSPASVTPRSADKHNTKAV